MSSVPRLQALAPAFIELEARRLSPNLLRDGRPVQEYRNAGHPRMFPGVTEIGIGSQNDPAPVTVALQKGPCPSRGRSVPRRGGLWGTVPGQVLSGQK